MGEQELVRLVTDFKFLGNSIDSTFTLLRLNFIDEYGIVYYRKNEGLLKAVLNKVYLGGSSDGELVVTS